MNFKRGMNKVLFLLFDCCECYPEVTASLSKHYMRWVRENKYVCSIRLFKIQRILGWHSTIQPSSPNGTAYFIEVAGFYTAFKILLVFSGTIEHNHKISLSKKLTTKIGRASCRSRWSPYH